VQPNNFLGIYLAKDHATVVCLAFEGSTGSIAGFFTVALEQGQEPDFNALAQRISSGCTERGLKFNEAAVALDCSMFMQHKVSSEFSDVKRIAQTVRFDTEEALGADATNIAIAFRINSTGQAGANLSVFTVPKQPFSELLSALQSNNIDPVSIEPDVNSLARFVCQRVPVASDYRVLFAFLSGRNGYFIAPLSSPWHQVRPMPAAEMRTFLLHPAQNRAEMLTKQLYATTAFLGDTQPVNRLEIFNTTDLVNIDLIGDRMSLPAGQIDVIESAGLSPENPDLSRSRPDLVEFSIAYGAALAYSDPPGHASWRSDYMPYQGRKMRLQSAMKYLSVAVTVLMLALGVYGSMEAVALNKYRARFREKLAEEYSKVMFGDSMPAKTREAIRKITTALRRIKDAQKGNMSPTGEDAVAVKLAMVLQAFNECASATSLHVESVNITDKSITISGDTSSADNTLKVFDALSQANLDILQQRVTFEGGRSAFNVTVEPKNK
jgi:hypothetical protein